MAGECPSFRFLGSVGPTLESLIVYRPLKESLAWLDQEESGSGPDDTGLSVSGALAAKLGFPVSSHHGAACHYETANSCSFASRNQICSPLERLGLRVCVCGVPMRTRL